MMGGWVSIVVYWHIIVLSFMAQSYVWVFVFVVVWASPHMVSHTFQFAVFLVSSWPHYMFELVQLQCKGLLSQVARECLMKQKLPIRIAFLPHGWSYQQAIFHSARGNITLGGFPMPGVCEKCQTVMAKYRKIWKIRKGKINHGEPT